jgi:hypothetical protein
MRRILVPAVICSAWLVGPTEALAGAPAQLSGTYATTGFQTESVTPAGSNLKLAVDEQGTFDGDMQGNWAWEARSVFLANGGGTAHGTFVCSPCTIERRTGSFTAVAASGARQTSIRFTITAAFDGLAGLHGDVISTGGATGTYAASLFFTQ